MKLEQAQSRRSYQGTSQSSRKAPARNRNTSEDKNENELAEVLKAKIREVLQRRGVSNESLSFLP